jgi:hypothetical protein
MLVPLLRHHGATERISNRCLDYEC